MAAAAGTAHGAVKRELLVRYLDACAPAVLHGSRRMTYAEGYAAGAGEPSAVAALRVFAEFADLLAGRRLDVVLVADDAAAQGLVAARLAEVRAESGLPDECRVHTTSGPLLAALTGVGAFGAPILALLDATAPGATAPDDRTLAALATNPGGEVLLFLPAGRSAYRAELHEVGFALVTSVELIDGGGAEQLLFFGTNAERHLDTFKDALWAVDEYAGVRYRDPGDPEHGLLDISLAPHLGPLRRLLLDRVRAQGAGTVAQLRQYTRTETVYRIADVAKALQSLATAGSVVRTPDHGRLTAETEIRPG